MQQYITANEFRRLPTIVDVDDDDISSVSSSIDEPDKGRLADSSLSLGSEVESAYESVSEDGESNVSHSRARTGGRARVYDVRTLKRNSRSRSRSRSRSPDRAPTYRNAPAPPARCPVHRRAVDPPRPYAGPTGVNDSGNVRFSALPSPLPPMPGRELMAHCAEVRVPPDPRLGDDRMDAVSMAHQQQRLSDTAIQQQNERVKRIFEGHRGSPGFIDLDGKAVPPPSLPPSAILPLRSGPPSQPRSWSQLCTGPDSRPYMAPPVANQIPWSLGPQRSEPMPHQQPLPSDNPPMKDTHSLGKTSLPAAMHSSSAASSASSSASSTPTVTASSNVPADFSGAWPSASIDYRLVIKTGHPRSLDAMSDFHEHRVVARTPPTRSDINSVALRYIRLNPMLFPKIAPKGSCRAIVTRAVFSIGQGREESYDLTSYAEHDFSKLCEIMKRAGEEVGSDGLPQVRGWPLFEIVVSNWDS